MPPQPEPHQRRWTFVTGYLRHRCGSSAWWGGCGDQYCAWRLFTRLGEITSFRLDFVAPYFKKKLFSLFTFFLLLRLFYCLCVLKYFD